jgi:hypothetical protein
MLEWANSTTNTPTYLSKAFNFFILSIKSADIDLKGLKHFLIAFIPPPKFSTNFEVGVFSDIF